MTIVLLRANGIGEHVLGGAHHERSISGLITSDSALGFIDFYFLTTLFKIRESMSS